MTRRKFPYRPIGWLILVVIIALGVYGGRDAIRELSSMLLAKRALFSQIKALTDLSADFCGRG